MSKKKLSALELKLKKQLILAGAYTDKKVSASKVHLIEQATAASGYLKTYILAEGVDNESAVVESGTGKNLIGKINIPKDFLVKSASVQTVATADSPYTGAQIGDKYIDFVINTKDTTNGSETDTHVYLPVNELVDVYTGGNGVNVSNSNVISIDIDANGGLELTGSTDGQKQLAIKLDSTNANGLALTSAGLKLALATTSAAGAMSAADKTKLDKALTSDDIALLSDNEMGSWLGFSAAEVSTILGSVSDDSITDEE
jgi:hypothetical protein